MTINIGIQCSYNCILENFWMVLIEIINYSLTCWRPASYTFFSTITIIDPISVSVQGKIECGCLKRLNLAAILGRYKQIHDLKFLDTILYLPHKGHIFYVGKDNTHLFGERRIRSKPGNMMVSFYTLAHCHTEKHMQTNVDLLGSRLFLHFTLKVLKCC